MGANFQIVKVVVSGKVKKAGFPKKKADIKSEATSDGCIFCAKIEKKPF